MKKNIEFECEIIKKSFGGGCVDFIIENEELAKLCQCGQFVQIDCGGKTFLRRPISICDVNGSQIRIIFQIRGEGTLQLAEFNAGDSLNIIGPLGHGFSINKNDENVVFVGGGLGIFPLLMPAKKYGSNATVILGYRNAAAVYLEKEFTDAGCKVITMTDDGSYGQKGFTTDSLETLINQGSVGKIKTCGPHIMMKKVAEMAIKHDIECEVSMESRMSCGIGMCLCCVQKIHSGNEIDHVCVCKYGPVMDAGEVVW